MIINRKVQFEPWEIMEAKMKFEKRHGFFPSRCTYNPEIVDIDHIIKHPNKYQALIDPQQQLADLKVFGIEFVQDIEQPHALEFFYIQVTT